MVIVSVPVESFNTYRADPQQVLDRVRRCPRCETRTLTRHGRFLRWIYELEERTQIPVFRLRCRPCRLTLTLLPDCLIPYSRYALPIVEEALLAYADTPSSLRAVAVAITGTVLTGEQSVSDTLLWTHLHPGFQRIHAWATRMAAVATRDLQTAISWLVALVPDTPVVALLSIPLPAVRTKVRSPEKAQGLAAIRLLPRVLALSPELNPHRRSWVSAWLRVAAVLFGRAGWRGPPGLPQSS